VRNETGEFAPMFHLIVVFSGHLSVEEKRLAIWQRMALKSVFIGPKTTPSAGKKMRDIRHGRSS